MKQSKVFEILSFITFVLAFGFTTGFLGINWKSILLMVLIFLAVLFRGLKEIAEKYGF